MYQYKRMSFIEMEKETGIGWWTNRNFFLQNGIPIMSKEEIYRRRRKRDLERLYNLHYHDQLTLKDIYKRYGFTPVYVRKVRKAHGLAPIKRDQYGCFKKS